VSHSNSSEPGAVSLCSAAINRKKHLTTDDRITRIKDHKCLLSAGSVKSVVVHVLGTMDIKRSVSINGVAAINGVSARVLSKTV
jgi:hypothetical protein